VKRKLRLTPSFERMLRRLAKRNREATATLQPLLELLSDDAFHPRLRTHKLKGHLDGKWSAKAGYDLRVVFEFVREEDEEVILLHAIGTHDDVY